MQALIILCIAIPLVALLYIIKQIVDEKKRKNSMNEKLNDIIMEYQIMAEKRKQGSSEEQKK